MSRMKISLYLTEENCFRSGDVLERIRERLVEGVAVSSRDHPQSFPKGIEHACDNWGAVLSARPALAVLDNLVFDEPRGRTFRCWDADECVYRSVKAEVLDATIRDLQDAGVDELILVSEDETVSGGWEDWIQWHEIRVIPPDLDADWNPRRSWWLYWDCCEPETRYRYPDSSLLQHRGKEHIRQFKAHFTAPQTEALLALVAEYSASRYEYSNPDDPRALNARNDMCHRIVQAFAGSWNPRELLSAVEDLYDLVSEHVDFSRPYPETAGNGGSGVMMDKGGNNA